MSDKDEVLRLTNTRWLIQSQMTNEELTGEWARWTCPVCQVEMNDPVSTSATVCSNNHIVYLGEVYEHHRRAFTSRDIMNASNADEKSRHRAVQLILTRWKNQHPEGYTAK